MLLKEFMLRNGYICTRSNMYSQKLRARQFGALIKDVSSPHLCEVDEAKYLQALKENAKRQTKARRQISQRAWRARQRYLTWKDAETTIIKEV